MLLVVELDLDESFGKDAKTSAQREGVSTRAGAKRLANTTKTIARQYRIVPADVGGIPIMSRRTKASSSHGLEKTNSDSTQKTN
jgi:hypothetical protein